MNYSKIPLVGLILIGPLAALAMTAAWGQTLATPVYMQDTPSDTGVEPNPDTGSMWVSEDIWVRNSPDPGYQPYPFTEGSPPWTLPPNQDALYRDPLKSTPNYVYVEVRNHSAVASTGTERLRLYWAKASTGLSWPTQWVDYQPGGPLTPLYGAEITKPRKNAATASTTEISAYVNAILGIATLGFPMGADYWHTQQTEHSLMGNNTNIHDTLAFLPWHREFVNRYELLLQQYDPTVKLFYWDWTTDPSSLDTTTFMGSATGSIGSPFLPALLPPAVSRGLGGPTPPAEPDSTVVARDGYGPYTSACGGGAPCPSTTPFMAALENFSHNFSHGYIGGFGGNMSHPGTSAQDPFFFLLHTNVDKLWSEWQRSSANVPRLDPAQTYGASLASDVNLQLTMSPWDGSPGGSTSTSTRCASSGVNCQIQPWETTTPAPSGGNYVVAKLPDDPSVVSPPIYDTAPLTIPVLQPGQAAVLQVPWYPPNPANFASFGSDQYHFCLLARIETSTTAPFGMTTPETSDVFVNTKSNNHIVWKNITVLENLPGPRMHFSILIRNPFDEPIKASLRLAPSARSKASLSEYGRVVLDLGPELSRRWREAGGAGRDVKPLDEKEPGRVQIVSPSALIENVRLNPKEAFPVSLFLELRKDYPLRDGPFPEFDLVQIGAPGNPNAIVGGQRFDLELSRLVLIKSGDLWHYWDATKPPREGWLSETYDDAGWRVGTAPFGVGRHAATTLNRGAHRTPLFFRRAFEVTDPSFYRSTLLRVVRGEGARVYLNGREVFPVGRTVGAAKAGRATTARLSALQREVLFPVRIELTDLKPGMNVIAVEVQRNSTRRAGAPFDLELSANNAAGFAPEIAFSTPAETTQVQTGEVVAVQLEAYASEGKIESVSLYADGEKVGTSNAPPFNFNWRAASPGVHRLRAVAVDDRGRQSESFRSVTVVESLLPSVKLSVPQRTAFAEGKAVPISAEASQRNGKIARVEFWAHDMALFTSPMIKVATVTAPPYTASIKGLKPGHYMVWAIAVNDRGGSTQSFPGHIMIEAPK